MHKNIKILPIWIIPDWKILGFQPPERGPVHLRTGERRGRRWGIRQKIPGNFVMLHKLIPGIRIFLKYYAQKAQKYAI